MSNQYTLKQRIQRQFEEGRREEYIDKIVEIMEWKLGAEHFNGIKFLDSLDISDLLTIYDSEDKFMAIAIIKGME